MEEIQKEGIEIFTVPIHDHKGLKGWFGVAYSLPISEEDRAFIDYLSVRISFLVTETMARHSDREKRLILINHITMQLTKSLRMEESISYILASFLDFLGKKRGAIYLKNDHDDAFDLISERDFIGHFQNFKTRIKGDQQWLMEIMNSIRGKCLDEFLEQREFFKKRAHSRSANFVIGRPILQRGQEVGLFFVGNNRPFSDADLEKISFLMDQLILFLDHFYLYRRLKDIGLSSIGGRSIEEVSQTILDQIARSLRAKALWLMLYNNETQMLEMTACLGLSDEKYKDHRMAVGEGITWNVFTSQKPIFINDIRNEFNFLNGKKFEEEGIYSCLAVPLIYNGESIGILDIFNPEMGDDPSFEQEKMDLLTLLSTQAAIAIQNVRYARELEELKLEWASAFDSIPDIICIIDRNYKIVKSNKALSLRFGNSEEEGFLYQYCFRLIRNRETPCEECPHRETIETGLPHYKEWNQGNQVFLILTSPIQTREGQTDKTVYFMKDISQEKEKERRLHQYKKMAEVGTLISKIAHDIRNPLGAIANSVSVLGRFIQKDGPTGQLLNIALEEVQRLKEMLSEFMEFTRIPKPKLQKVDIVGLIEEALELLRKDESLMKDIIMEKNYPLESVLCYLDPSMIRSALWNIFRNAAEAMPEGGRLQVSLKCCEIDKKEWVEIIIMDTGIGIPSEVADRIFEPFVTTKEKGTGLGLSMVYQIVSEHGGTIDISPAPQRGTFVTLKFPLRGEYEWRGSF
jgi:signal transduction histidine kinase/GAF domain-containing protein